MILFMNENEIVQKLKTLTTELYFMSESDYPFEVFNWGILNDEEIKCKILSTHNPDSTLIALKTSDLFEKIIRNLKITEESVSISIAKRYELLFDFIKTNEFETRVYKCGGIEIDVYILIVMPSKIVLGLKTISIET